MKWGFDPVAIKKLVSPIRKWDPRKCETNQALQYIDISSVSRETKDIEAVTEILAHEAPSRARQLVKINDVLVSTVRPNLNAVAQVRASFNGATASTGFTVLRPKADKLDPRYLYYWVRTPYFIEDMTRQSTGASYPAVSDSIVKDYFIPLPPIAEQRRIAAILDKADAIRRKRKQAIQYTEELLRAAFLDMFGDPVTNPKGWDVTDLPNILFFQEGPGVRKWQFRDEGIKLLNVKNIVSGTLVLDNTDRYLDESEVASKYSHFLADTDDLVMASSGATWGKTAWVKKDNLPLCMNTSTIRFRPKNNEVLRSYMYGFLNSVSFKNQIERLITGSAQPNFGPAHLKQVKMLVPPIEVQRSYENFSELNLSLVESKKKSMSESNNLFNSLLQRAFRGEL